MIGSDNEEMSVADKLRRNLKYAEDARARAREVKHMADWIQLSRNVKPLLIRVPKHFSLAGEARAKELVLTPAERDALIEFLTARAEHEYAKADGIDKYCIREAARQQKEDKA